jgi:hypothetical protein
MTKTLLKRTVSIVLSALLLMSVFSITAFAEEVIGYGVWVGDTEVTSLNCDDIPSVMGGKAYYDSETATLTLDNVRDIRGESYDALIFSRNDLNIELIGYSSPSADYDGLHRYTGIYCLKNLTINSKSVAGLVLQGVAQVVEVYGSFTLNNGVIDAMILPPQEDSYGLFNPIGIHADTVRINGGHVFLEKMNSSAYVDEEIGIFSDNIYITGGTTILSRFREGMTANNIAITGGKIEIIEGRRGIYAMDSFEVSGNNTEVYINTYATDSKAVLAYANSPFTVGEDVEIVYPREAKLGYVYGNWPTFTDKDGNVLQEVHIKTKTVQVKWYNEDGTLLYESPCNVNTKPEYHGPTPEKESTDTTYFVFKGWTPELEPIKADESYTAQFEEKDRTIKVKVQLPSGETEEVELDVYSNVEKVLNKVIEDNDLEAEDTFMTLPDDSLRIHPEESLYRLQVGDGDTLILHHRVNVIWMNGDGKVLDSKSYMSDREEPKTNKTPTKDEDEKYTYEFDKWDDGEYNGHTKVYTPVWKKTEKPTEPVTDASTEPETTELVTDAPTESFTAEPTQSATIEPTGNIIVDPTEPSTAVPTQPATIEPTGNIIVDPTEPSTAEPTQPATVEPTESIIVDPTVPATVEPTAPEVTEPVDTTPVATNPEETTPTVPVDTTPVVTDPIITEPVVTNPITTDPVVTEPSTPPAATDPTQPPVVKPDESKTKKANPMTVEIKKKTVKAKKLKKKAQKIKAITVKNNVGKVTYKLVKKGITKRIRKLVKINKKGVITIKKWKKAKKGNYKIKVKIFAKGNASYNAKTIIKVIKVKIK